MRTTDNIDLGHGDIHVESLYIFHDGDDLVEYGWDFDWEGVFTNLWVFDARLFQGSGYALRLDFHPTIAPMHEFRMRYDSSDGRYRFDYDGDQQPFARDPIWSTGRPHTTQEILNQCNGGVAHFWHLERETSSGSWVDWGSTHWNCDTETEWGFDYLSDTEFKVSSRDDNFTGGCDPVNS